MQITKVAKDTTSDRKWFSIIVRLEQPPGEYMVAQNKPDHSTFQPNLGKFA